MAAESSPVSAPAVERPAVESPAVESPAVESPAHDPDGPDDMAHYARNDELAAARREGRAVRALCGTLFRPHADPSKLAVCVVCQDLAAAWRG
jgi:hypothetical protein